MFAVSASVDSESEPKAPEAMAGKETIEIKEVVPVDHILPSLQRKVCKNVMGFPCSAPY